MSNVLLLLLLALVYLTGLFSSFFWFNFASSNIIKNFVYVHKYCDETCLFARICVDLSVALLLVHFMLSSMLKAERLKVVCSC